MNWPTAHPYSNRLARRLRPAPNGGTTRDAHVRIQMRRVRKPIRSISADHRRPADQMQPLRFRPGRTADLIRRRTDIQGIRILHHRLPEFVLQTRGRQGKSQHRQTKLNQEARLNPSEATDHFRRLTRLPISPNSGDPGPLPVHAFDQIRRQAKPRRGDPGALPACAYQLNWRQTKPRRGDTGSLPVRAFHPIRRQTKPRRGDNILAQGEALGPTTRIFLFWSPAGAIEQNETKGTTHVLTRQMD